ncbi:DUF6691 family protein [Paracoccus sp. JM45]|uniref:DUF6691 family protein n=1 Tax=Paracoccus sp. JM45 TaxID=2283626 RepID=UPI000E6CA2FC|nr:DUF6691 family protein [Paracoccus sp. JM45]RJE80344.1 hypothetical protein DWB67_08690 [Paracoccus sp. JM45]
MIRLLIAAISGGLFGAGLAISGMTDPAKVRGWLDIFGAWDPTLAFVLGGAILFMAIAWRFKTPRQPAPSAPVDGRLIGGAALFGLGWGLSGLCPGPAMASLTFSGPSVVIFFTAMAAGMALFGIWSKRV